MRGSAQWNSLKADLSALRKAIAPLIADGITLDELMFACADQLLRGTAYGAADVFEYLEHAVPRSVGAAFPENADETTLGYLYQLVQLSRRAELQARIQQANKSTSQDDLIAFTSLYTPDWVVRFLVDRVDGESLVDPACGAGNFLLEATSKYPLRKLAGYDIDDTALFIARLSLTVQALRGGVELECVPELDLFCLDTLTRHKDEPKFDAVVGNPPYIGRKLMDRELKQRLKREYPASHSDLCAAFVERGMELLNPGGKLAFITQASLLVLPTYEELRRLILRDHRLDTVVELGPHVFPLVSGEKVNSVLLVIEQGQQGSEPCSYLDLRDVVDKETAMHEATWSHVDQSMFEKARAAAFNFSCPPSLFYIRERSARLGDHADIRQGLATTDNARFVKHRSAVPAEEIGTRWIPYAKGSGSERWYAPINTVVDWANGGEAIKQRVAEKYPYLAGKTEWVVKNESYYFREGLTFSFVNSKNLAVRWLPPGCIFDVGGSALFSDEQWFLLAYLNSSFIAECARSLNPTINFQVGDLKELPYVSVDAKDTLAEYARRCVQLKRAFYEADAWTEASAAELQQLEEEIDRIVLDAARRVCVDVAAAIARPRLSR